MRTSCNGCRVLRKGCSDDCTIRPCLIWIKSPDAQANATLFLAKFYGRAGLLNLLSAGPDNLRPAVFQSLLYEACGRVVDPVYGSVGLLYSGQWQHCQMAVDAVLKGLPIMQLPNAASHQIRLYDIRHMTSTITNTPPPPNNNNNNNEFPQKIRTRLKRRPRVVPDSNADDDNDVDDSIFSLQEGEERREAAGTREGGMGLELTLGFTYNNTNNDNNNINNMHRRY